MNCSVDFIDSGTNIIKPICQELKDLLLTENDEQIEKFSEIIHKAVRTNLDDFL